MAHKWTFSRPDAADSGDTQPRKGGTIRESFTGRTETSLMQAHADPTATWDTTAGPMKGAHRVLIVNGSTDVLEVLEPVLDAGNYDVVFVEANAHAYSQIRRVQPDLVILCLEMDDPEGLRVLSMLKLDEETRDIPIVTYTATGVEPSVEDGDDAEPRLLEAAVPSALMN
jgi:PleD family two-component response regulator